MFVCNWCFFQSLQRTYFIVNSLLTVLDFIMNKKKAALKSGFSYVNLIFPYGSKAAVAAEPAQDQVEANSVKSAPTDSVPNVTKEP